MSKGFIESRESHKIKSYPFWESTRTCVQLTMFYNPDGNLPKKVKMELKQIRRYLSAQLERHSEPVGTHKSLLHASGKTGCSESCCIPSV